jgi:hypothetical protein
VPRLRRSKRADVREWLSTSPPGTLTLGVSVAPGGAREASVVCKSSP